MIDLHVHTTASDGQYSPTQIIQMAAEKNIGTIAITDHDTVAGLEEGAAAAPSSRPATVSWSVMAIVLIFFSAAFSIISEGVYCPSEAVV